MAIRQVKSPKRKKPVQEPRKVVVLYQDISPDAPKDEQDVMEEVGAISGVLTRPGFHPIPVPVNLDFKKAISALRKIKPDFIFNLTESLEGKGTLIYLAPALLDYLEIPYTGATTEAMFMTSNKLLSKRIMKLAGLPTLPWLSEGEIRNQPIPFEPPYILKSIWEHASVGVHEHSVIHKAEDLNPALDKYAGVTGKGFYLEPYIDGREINVAMLGGREGMEVMPPSEILFENYPKGKLKIVDYKAKWVEDSFEYEHTNRSFDFPDEDTVLIGRCQELAAQCWELFGLRGYARLDIRVDKKGHPWIMEVNTNPCINPESGFVASTREIGLDYSEVIERIIQDSIPDISFRE